MLSDPSLSSGVNLENPGMHHCWYTRVCTTVGTPGYAGGCTMAGMQEGVPWRVCRVGTMAGMQGGYHGGYTRVGTMVGTFLYTMVGTSLYTLGIPHLPPYHC